MLVVRCSAVASPPCRPPHSHCARLQAYDQAVSMPGSKPWLSNEWTEDRIARGRQLLSTPEYAGATDLQVGVSSTRLPAIGAQVC